jgi:hypothetical protein
MNVMEMKKLLGENDKALQAIIGIVEVIHNDDDPAIKLDAYEKIIDVLDFYWYGELLSRPERNYLYE